MCVGTRFLVHLRLLLPPRPQGTQMIKVERIELPHETWTVPYVNPFQHSDASYLCHSSAGLATL